MRILEAQNAFIQDEDLLSSEELGIKMIADFQFGLGAGTLLIGSSARFLLSRNELYKSIIGNESYGKLQLGRYLRNSGRVQLNYQGGERLRDFSEMTIVLNTMDITGTTIFKPGIDQVPNLLSSGDEVIILGPKKEYLGVGTMVVNSSTVLRIRRGAVVKVRKIRIGG
jgi:archaeosine-15-forming tRNA-guanine transglycosylase